MPGGVVDPFNADVSAEGSYRYTRGDRRSTTEANARFSALVADLLLPGDRRILDIGCGDGTYTAELLRRPETGCAVGIDPASAAIERARRLYGSTDPRLSFRACTAADLLTEADRYDVAILRGVIHHVSDPAAEIRTSLELARSVVLLEPNGWNPGLKLLERLSPYHRSHRERSYPLHRLRRWVEEAGGQVVRVRLFGLVPMFCADWLVGLGRALEPLVEPLPVIRSLACGQVVLRADRRDAETGGEA